RCAYGAQLGVDADSRFVAQSLQREGVNLSPVVWNEQAQPIHSTVVVDTTHHTRNIFWEKNGAVGAHDELPDEETIRNCRVLFVDHYGTTGSIRAAQIARQGGIPLVADLERDNVPRFAELLGLVDHLVVSQPFALHLTRATNLRDAVRVLVAGRTAVVVTCGENGCWFASRDDQTPRHFPAFAVETIDSTGCGDIFHGAYACELARGETLDNRVRFAAAAAALKATRRGVQTGAPTRTQVEAFLHASNEVSSGS
ncbi:MAG TPA: PfkB family carbohydrate kinase, partial [Abditibacteriaceae bacterium]|nr:PfkB family carbohydrate kinase [Abditibacteriaceae bacterium]